MSSVSGTGLNFESISQTMGQKAVDAEKQLQETTESMDPQNVAQMIELQRQSTVWSNLVSTHSALIKNLGDALRGVVQKM